MSAEDVTVREFTRQAASFETPGSHFADRGVLDWIGSHIDLSSDARVLDVAGGTGQLGRHLARSARLAVVADLTRAMLAAGAEAVRREGRSDVIFVHADAAALPFSDGQFEVVVSRFALHHILDVPAVLAEMRRMCASAGSVTVIDMVTEPGAIGVRFDEFERLRDPSHVAAPRADELESQLRAADLVPIRVAERDETLAAEPWLDRAHPSASARTAVLEALRDEAAGGEISGLHAAMEEGELTISHHYRLISTAAR